jgi:hypothetical protein
MLIKKTYEIPTSLTHSLGQIEAEFPAATYSVPLTGLAANTLYFLYTRKVSNVASLAYSTIVPSTYIVSFPDTVLVGAFYSNGLASVSFGSFVNIEGTPATQNEIPFTLSPLFTGGNGTATAVGTSTYSRVGPNVFVAMRPSITKGTASGSLGLTGLPFTVAQYGKSEVHCGTGNTFTGLIASGTVYCNANPFTNTVSYAQVNGTNQGINPITVANMTVGAMDLINEFVYTTSFNGKDLKDL